MEKLEKIAAARSTTKPPQQAFNYKLLQQGCSKNNFQQPAAMCLKSVVSNEVNPPKRTFRATVFLTEAAGKELTTKAARQRVDPGKIASDIVMDFFEGKLVRAEETEATA